MSKRRFARNHSAIMPAMVSLAVVGALSGCSAGDGTYPSLASRPAERLTDAAPAATPPAGPAVAVAPSPELTGKLDKLVAQARRARQDFDDRQAAAETLIVGAGSAPAGSEAWARATQALSGVQSARSQTAQPLSDLDRLDVEDQLQGATLGPDENASRPDTAAIAQARAAIATLVAEEDTVLAKLDWRLPQ